MTPSKSHSNFSRNGRGLTPNPLSLLGEGALPRIALIIGGSDPTGGAGIQVDLKTFQHFGVHGLSVITAVTVQNTRGVISTNPVSVELVEEQLNALSEDIAIDTIKIGMMTTVDVVDIVTNFIEKHRLPVVLDPILASSNGIPFLEETDSHALLRRLCPLSSLITPNIPEASTLTGISITSEATMVEAALRMNEAGANCVLIKGGHAAGTEARDLFFDGTEIEWLSAPRSAKQVHGTGCVLSSAIASGLALGMPMREAIGMAKDFITEMIEEAAPLGRGQEIFQFTSSLVV